MEATGRIPLIVALLLFSGDVTASSLEPIPYACDEVVVVGRVRTVAYTDPTQDDDLLGHGSYSMQVRIKKVLRGKELRRVVPATGFSHAQMREDADFWMVLGRMNDDSYVIRTANLTRFPFRLARECDRHLLQVGSGP